MYGSCKSARILIWIMLVTVSRGLMASRKKFVDSILRLSTASTIESLTSRTAHQLDTRIDRGSICGSSGLYSMSSSDTFIAPPKLAASRLGLDPLLNRFHAPIVNHENYSCADWPATHTFPMDKFDRLAHALQTTCSRTFPGLSALSRPLVRSQKDFFRPLDSTNVPRLWLAEPTGPINPDFLDRFLTSNLDHEEKKYIGFREQTDRPELIERTVLEVAGTVLAAQLAFHYGIASNVAGGTHHAHRDMGAGYTILNDLAITANFLTDEVLNGGSVKGVRRVLVVDCDVHQGDGTAKFGDLGNQRLSTLSLHCASNYPHMKAHSTYDVGLRDGCEDDEYMESLEKSVNKAIAEVNPDFVLYDAGVDVYAGDKLGRLKVSEAGIRRRDRWILERCVAAGLPIAAVVGGGYDKDVDALARRHAIIHEECAYVWRKHRMWKRGGKVGNV